MSPYFYNYSMSEVTPYVHPFWFHRFTRCICLLFWHALMIDTWHPRKLVHLLLMTSCAQTALQLVTPILRLVLLHSAQLVVLTNFFRLKFHRNHCQASIGRVFAKRRNLLQHCAHCHFLCCHNITICHCSAELLIRRAAQMINYDLCT